IRVFHVTGVQTCALPICRLSVRRCALSYALPRAFERFDFRQLAVQEAQLVDAVQQAVARERLDGEGDALALTEPQNGILEIDLRSEERRVGQEYRSRGPH